MYRCQMVNTKKSDLLMTRAPGSFNVCYLCELTKTEILSFDTF